MFQSIKNFLFSSSENNSVELSSMTSQHSLVKRDVAFFRNRRFQDFVRKYSVDENLRKSPKTGKYNSLLIDSGLVTRVSTSEVEGVHVYEYVVQIAHIPVDDYVDRMNDLSETSSESHEVEYESEEEVAYALKTFTLEEFGALIDDFILKYEVEPKLGLGEDFVNFAVFLFIRNQNIIASNTPSDENSYFKWMTSDNRDSSMKKLYSKFYDRHFLFTDSGSDTNDRFVSICALQEIINYCKITNTPSYFSQMYNSLRC